MRRLDFPSIRILQISLHHSKNVLKSGRWIVRAIKEIDIASFTIIDGPIDMAETRSTGGLFSLSPLAFRSFSTP